MKFTLLAALSLGSLSFAAPAAQGEDSHPAPTEAPAFPSTGGSGSSIESFRSRRGGGTGGVPFPRPTRSGGSRPVPTGFSGIPSIGSLAKDLSEYEADESEFGVAAATGRRGGRHGGRHGGHSRGGAGPTGVFPTGSLPDFPAPTGGFPGSGDSVAKREVDDEEEAGFAFPTGRRGGHGHGGVFPTGAFPGFPHPTGGFPGFPHPTGGFPGFPRPTGESGSVSEVESSSSGDEVEQEAGVAAPTGRHGGHRGGHGRGGARPTGVFPTGSRPGFPSPTGSFGKGSEKRSFDDSETEEQGAGSAAPTGRRGGRRGGHGRGGVRPTGVFPGFPSPTGSGTSVDGNSFGVSSSGEGSEEGEQGAGVAAPTGRRGGRGGGRGGARPTGVFPGFPRPTGSGPSFGSEGSN